MTVNEVESDDRAVQVGDDDSELEGDSQRPFGQDAQGN